MLPVPVVDLNASGGPHGLVASHCTQSLSQIADEAVMLSRSVYPTRRGQQRRVMGGRRELRNRLLCVVQFMGKPLQIRLAARDNGNGNDLRYLIRVLHLD
jgi:hypothetical protein